MSPPSIPQPAQKPHSLNVNDDKTPGKGDNHVFFQLLGFSFLALVPCIVSHVFSVTVVTELIFVVATA